MTKNIITGIMILASAFFSNMLFAQDQKAIDDKLLQDYFTANKIQPEKTASGLYYRITTPGEGAHPQVGKKVVMNYRGKLLDGKQFDANVDENYKPVNGRDPFSFTLGMGRVIKGWDEGVQLLQKGTRATFFLPSDLAYGPRAVGGVIPANSVLIFDVELVSFEN